MSNPASTARLHRLLAFLEHDAGNLALRIDAIREASDTGEWQTANSLITVGLELHPDSALLLAHSGFAHLQARRHADAEQALFAALLQGLDSQEVRYNLAYAQVMQQHYTQALEMLLDPVTQEVPRALLLRARCLHHLQRTEEALVDCHAHLRVASQDTETHGLLALLLQELNRYDEAREHIDAALQRDPQQMEALLALAGIQQDTQDYDAAARSFQCVVSAHPQCGRAWLGLALVELTHLQFAGAKQAIEQAAVHLSEHIGTWHVLAWTHLMLGEVDAAEQAFARALALDRNFAETHGGIAVVAALQGREDAARLSIKRAQRLDARSKAAQYAAFLLLQREGKHAAARVLFDELSAQPAGSGDLSISDLVRAHTEYLQQRDSQQGQRVMLH